MDRQARPGGRGWVIWLLLLGLTAIGSRWTSDADIGERDSFELPAPAHEEAPPRIVFPAERGPRFDFELRAGEAP